MLRCCWKRPMAGRRVVQVTMFTLLLSTLIANHQAGIIESILQHKYRPDISAPMFIDHINASSSSVLEHFEGQDGHTTSVEYHSPMDKIIEIISGKPRSIIVVDQKVEPEAAQSRLPTEPVASIDTNGLSLDQQWAIIGPAERYIPQGYGSSLTPQASHENIQMGSPRYEPIYTQQQLNDLERQILERAAKIQKINEPKPILLASYVPHVRVPLPSQAAGAPVMAPNVARPVPALVLMNTTTRKPSEGSRDSEGADQDGDDANDKTDERKGEPSKADRTDNDQEENEASPEESKNGGLQAEPDDEESSDEPSSGPSGFGSRNYHEKYDSDTMEEPSRNEGPVAESSSNVVTGLIGVGLNDDCLQCICRASSGCDYQLLCITRGADEKYCGPFQITEDYWKEAGSPGDAPNNFSAFDDCANNADCAVETVTNYMKRNHKDCDGDGNITCLDYARLHKLKPDECENTEKLTNNFDFYWAKFQRCAEGYNRSRTLDDED